MTPSAKELADGQRACERLERFQRAQRGSFDLLLIAAIGAGLSVWHDYQRNGWRGAFIATAVWLSILLISTYQLRRQKKRAEKDSLFLAKLKNRYGEGVYADIRRVPHSLIYNLFQKRFPPFNQQSLKLP